MFIYILASFLLVTAPLALGVCPQGKADFDSSQFAGTWYVVTLPAGDTSTSPPVKCMHQEFSAAVDDKISVSLHMYDISPAAYTTSNGTLRNADATSNAANFYLKRSGNDFEEPYNLIATDYTNYAVFCSTPLRGGEAQDMYWISSRQLSLDSNFVTEASQYHDGNDLTVIDNSDCSHEH